MSKRKKSKWARAGELKAWREAHGLNKSRMVDLLRNSGLRRITYATYLRWEAGAVVPHEVFEEKLFEILRAAK